MSDRTVLGWVSRAVACLVSGAVFAASGYIWYEYRSLIGGLTTSHALDVLRDGAPAHLDNSVNLLLIGLDSRKDQDGRDLPKEFVSDELHAGSSDIGGYNTNTLILMHIPANGGRVEAFSVPRDDYVDLVNAPGAPRLGKHKIKEAYDRAKYFATEDLRRQGVTDPVELEHRGREAGRKATLLTVQQLLNLPIDHFAEVNLLGFYDVAKALGPLTVCLNHDVDDPVVARTATTAGHGSGAHFHQGLNQLDAAQALSFVRQRYGLPNNDLDRTHRQQAFLAAATKKLKDQGLFADFGRLQSLLSVVQKDVVIDSSWDVLDFAQQAPNLTGGNVEFNTLPIASYAALPSDGDVNLVDTARIRAMVRQQIGISDPSAAAARPPAAVTASDSPSPTSTRSRSATASPSPSDSGSASYQGPAVVAGGIPCVN